MEKFLLVCLVSLLTACGGSEEPQKTINPTPVHVVVMGDSITAQSGMRIRDHLQQAKPGSTMENLGYNARRAQEMIDGTYGTLPTMNKDTVYVFSFGTNEYLQGRSVHEYIASMETILNIFKGYKVVLEAPWLIENKGCGCNDIREFRNRLQELGSRHGVPVVIEDTLDNTDSIHLTGPHMDLRAKLVATAILENY